MRRRLKISHKKMVASLQPRRIFGQCLKKCEALHLNLKLFLKLAFNRLKEILALVHMSARRASPVTGKNNPSLLIP